MAALRWWAEKVGRQNVIARTNDHYGIPERQFVTNVSKAQAIDADALRKVRDQHVRMSLELQQAFGLRREEAIKFIHDGKIVKGQIFGDTAMQEKIFGTK